VGVLKHDETNNAHLELNQRVLVVVGVGVAVVAVIVDKRAEPNA
jgi:hypothetical protein